MVWECPDKLNELGKNEQVILVDSEKHRQRKGARTLFVKPQPSCGINNWIGAKRMASFPQGKTEIVLVKEDEEQDNKSPLNWKESA